MDKFTYDDFQRIDIRVGRVDRSEPFPEARRPSLELWIVRSWERCTERA
jgi:tRNA-binding protein